MESNQESMKDPVSEFLVTGRTGRRNAMADILGPNASVTSGDLPKRLESLTTMGEHSLYFTPTYLLLRYHSLFLLSFRLGLLKKIVF